MLLRFAAAAFAVALAVRPPSSFAQTPSPAPSVPAPQGSAKPARTPPPKPTPTAQRIHRAIVNCDLASFYDWPASDSAPAPSSYPPARLGDAFDVIGDAQVSYSGLILYETTIDVVHPWGNGTHYWISSRCVNTV